MRKGWAPATVLARVLAALNKGRQPPAAGTCPEGHNHVRGQLPPLGRWAYPGRGIALRPCRGGQGVRFPVGNDLWISDRLRFTQAFDFAFA